MRKYIFCIAVLSAGVAFADVEVKDVALEKDGSGLNVAMNFKATGDKLKSDRDVTYTPIVTDGTDTLRLPAVIMAGHNRYIRHQRKNTTADGTILCHSGKDYAYSVRVPWQQWMETSHLDVIEDECNCGLKSGTTIYRRDLATLDCAPRHEFAPMFGFATPEGNREKQREAKGSAYIDFPVNRTEIYPDYRRNPEELAKIRATIDKVVNDPDTRITGVRIEGFASPEGSYANNVRLAEGRAVSLADYVRTLYSFGRDVFSISSVPENWAGLRAYVSGAQMEDSTGILAIIDDTSLAPDPREAKLKKAYPQEYAFMLKNVYPGLRRSDYAVQYVVRSYTSIDEIKALMKSAPEKLSASEIFAVANTYAPGSEDFNNAIRLAVAVAPDNAEANLNMAMLLLQSGNSAQAAPYLDKSGDSPLAVYARGIMAYRAGDIERAISLTEEAANAGLPQAKDALEQFRLMKLIE